MGSERLTTMVQVPSKSALSRVEHTGNLCLDVGLLGLRLTVFRVLLNAGLRGRKVNSEHWKS